jgi:hypothetical protein
MTPKFITLPSGTRMNTSKIISYRKEDNGVAIFTTEGPFMAPESMTLEQLDALLSPPQSAVVDPIVNLDNLRTGKACSFTYEGQVKHGVIKDFEVFFLNKVPFSSIRITSDGEDYDLHLNNEKVYLAE